MRAASNCANVWFNLLQAHNENHALPKFTDFFFAKPVALWFNLHSFLKKEVGPGSETIKPEPYV